MRANRRCAPAFAKGYGGASPKPKAQSPKAQSPEPLINNDLSDRMLRGMFGLPGEVAVVTGGLGRLGREYVRTLALAGADVAAFDVAGATEGFEDLVAAGARVSVHRVDITDKAEVDAALAAVVASFGAPTILVNNAGMGSSPSAADAENGLFEDYPEVAWDTMIDSHLKGTLFVSQAFVRAFRAAGRRAGSIVNVSSTYGVVSPEQAVYQYKRVSGATYFKPVGYSVAKSGVLNFTRWLAEYRRAARHPGQHAGARRRARGGARARVRRRIREAHADGPHGQRRRLQRRRAVPGLARVGLHDRRDGRRRRRLDSAVRVKS